ncbi:MAG TPA: membrane protein insertion efficiency factor YidD [Candidatus Absconditabacterales bacterium]|nr:membrane protein insertion efficiency factor YidD [Candidatus Absconditabacterales bacterium]
MIILKFIDKILTEISIILIKIYQYTISPDKGLPSLWLKGKICAHEPHCSKYSVLSFKRYGFFSGLPKVIERVFSCVGSKQKIYDPHKYNVVFFSSAPIGVPFLKELYKNKHFDIKGIVTNPDEKSGRGMKLKSNIIKTEGEKITPLNKGERGDLKNKFIQTPNSLRLDSKKYAEEAHNFKLRLEAKKPDYLVVIAYGKIIPKYILDIPKIAPINVHGSLLPKYRGASPIQSVFLNNEQKSGITIMKMDAKMDTGNMIDKLSTKLKFNRTTGDLIERMKQKGPKFLNKTLISYGKRLLGEVKQNEKQATYCKKIEKEDGEIFLDKDSLEDIYKKYKAYSLRPKIYFNTAPFTKGGNGDSIKPKRVIIEKLILDEKIFETEKNKPIIKGKELNKAIINISFKPEGKKSMNRESFKSGYLK